MGIAGLGIPPHEVGRELQRGVLLGLAAGDVFKHEVRVPEAALHVTPHEGGDDGQRRAVQTVIPLFGGRRPRPLDVVDDRREHLIFDGDLVDGLIRNVVRVGRYDRDWRSNLEHLFAEDVAERRAASETHILVFLRQVEAVQHVAHAGDLLRSARVDALHFGVRMRAAERLHEEHVGNRRVLRVAAGPGDDAESVRAGDFRADDIEDRQLGGQARSSAGRGLVAHRRADGGRGGCRSETRN